MEMIDFDSKNIKKQHSQFSKIRLDQFKKNIFSQKGEDGIIEKIFEIIGENSKICIEFGAWDGLHLSNTANLYRNKDWKAVLIEGNSYRYRDLLKNIRGYNCIGINQVVGIDPEMNTIEHILKEYKINNIDLISIDIDGNDYHIMDSFCELTPNVIIVEYNSSIPYHIDMYQDYSMDGNLGSSLLALVRLGIKRDIF